MKPRPDFVLEMIAVRLSWGLDVREAVVEVGLDVVQEAMIEATDAKDDEISGRLLACLSVKSRMDMDDADMEQALELTAAGWEPIDPRPPHLAPPKTIWEKTAVMSWQWRRPGKIAGKPGRLFHSTNQAFNALKKQSPTETDK